MGFLRIWLAMMVIVSHTEIVSGVLGFLAVECFFAISGFYMQMLISEQYAHQKNWMWKFWASRALRIYVPYWTILGVIIAFNWYINSIRINTTLTSLFTNIFILGSDVQKLLRLSGDDLVWANMVIPQVWSVAIELTMYLLAPFILTNLRVTFLITALSLTAKFWFVAANTPKMFVFPCWDGLLNSVLPFELGIFTTGALMYRLYVRFLKNTSLDQRYYWLMLGGGGVGTLIFCRFSLDNAIVMIVSYYLFLAVIVLMLPWLFVASKNMRLDRIVGGLSYSIYLMHHFIIANFPTMNIYLKTTSVMVITIFCALPIYFYIERPLDKFRHRRLRD